MLSIEKFIVFSVEVHYVFCRKVRDQKGASSMDQVLTLR